ncbi:MAG: hypothetical protein RR835_08615 [Peptostreptococcaceae bacterium]
MNIIMLEMKKVFRPLNILLVALITLISFNIFIIPEIEQLETGEPSKQDRDVGIILATKYGGIIDSKEMEDLKQIRDDKERESTEYLLRQPESEKANIKNYRDFYYGREQEFTQRREYVDIELLKEIEYRVLFEEDIYLFWELPIIEEYIDRYENVESVIDIDYYKPLGEKVVNRLEEIQASEKFITPMNDTVHSNYDEIMFWENVIVIISLIIIISPIFINDKKTKVNYIQYSSKTGRNIFKKKVITGLISTFIIVTIQLIIFFTAYKRLGTYAYWDTYINSIMSFNYFWFDLTFGQYIIMTVILLYIVSVLICLISMYISSKTISHLSLIGIQVPIAFGVIMFQLKFGTTYVTNIYMPKYTTLIIYSIIIIASIGLCLYMINKEKVLDIK